MTPAMTRESGAGLRRWGGCAAAAVLAHLAPLVGALGWIVPLDAAAPPQASAIMLELPPPPEPPPPEPTPPEPTPPQPPRPAVTPPVVRPPPVSALAPPLPEDPPPQPAAPASVAAPPAPVASVREAAPGAVTWQGRLLAHLETHKRYPREAQARRQEGVAYVRFVMDRRGRVLAAELRRSSGAQALDAEALALLARAQPLPAPPDDLPGETLSLTVPIEFFMKGRR